jgi:hypothetical protein
MGQMKEPQGNKDKRQILVLQVAVRVVEVGWSYATGRACVCMLALLWYSAVYLQGHPSYVLSEECSYVLREFLLATVFSDSRKAAGTQMGTITGAVIVPRLAPT